MTMGTAAGVDSRETSPTSLVLTQFFFMVPPPFFCPGSLCSKTSSHSQSSTILLYFPRHFFASVDLRVSPPSCLQQLSSTPLPKNSKTPNFLFIVPHVLVACSQHQL